MKQLDITESRTPDLTGGSKTQSIRPRQFADSICKLKTKEERRAYLKNKVPVELQELTARHVINYFLRVRG